MNVEQGTKAGFIDLRARAEMLELCGDAEGAEQLRMLSLAVAREVDLTCYAYLLMWRHKFDEAVEILERAVTVHPNSWNAFHTLGEVFEQMGDLDAASANYRRAARLVADQDGRRAIESAMDRIERMRTPAS